MTTIKNKFDKATITEAKFRAAELEQHAGGAHSLTMHQAKALLKTLKKMAPANPSQAKTLTSVINRLSAAVSNAVVDPRARSLPPGIENGGWGIRQPPAVLQLRPADPTQGTPFAKNQVDQVRLAVELGGLNDAAKLKNSGAFKPPVGVRYEVVVLEDRTPVDGAKLTAFVATDRVGSTAKKELDADTPFFLQIETHSRAGSNVQWGGPFELGVAGHRLATTLQANARDFAQQSGAALSRSDSVILSKIGPERSDGKFEATFNVAHFLDGKNVRGTVTALFNAGGDFVKNSFTAAGARPPAGETAIPARLEKKLKDSAFEFSQALGYPRRQVSLGTPSSAMTKVEYKSAKKVGDGFEVTYTGKNPDGELHASVDKQGKLLRGWFEIGKVPQRIEKKLDSYGELFNMAASAGKKTQHMPSKSHTVDLVSITANGDGTFKASLHVNHWRTAETAWIANVDLDKEGNFKAGSILQF
jgi:hypothetical protein